MSSSLSGRDDNNNSDDEDDRDSEEDHSSHKDAAAAGDDDKKKLKEESSKEEVKEEEHDVANGGPLTTSTGSTAEHMQVVVKEDEARLTEGGIGGGDAGGSDSFKETDAAALSPSPSPSPPPIKKEGSGKSGPARGTSATAAAAKKPTKRSTTTAKGRKKKPSDMPRRPLSAYNYFFREERARWLAESEQRAAHKDSAGGLFSAMGKAIAQRWKTLSDEEGRKYKDLAAEDMERYKKEMDEYHTAAARIRRLAESKASKAAAEADLEAARGDVQVDHPKGSGGGGGGGLSSYGIGAAGGGIDPYANQQDLLRSGGMAGAVGYGRGPDNADLLRMQQQQQAQGFPPGYAMGGMVDPALMAGMGAGGRPMMFQPRLNQPGMWNSYGGNPYLDAQPFGQPGGDPSTFGMLSGDPSGGAGGGGGPAGAVALRAQLFGMTPSPFMGQAMPGAPFDQGGGRWGGGMGGGGGAGGGHPQQQYLQAPSQSSQPQQQHASAMYGVPAGAAGMSNLYYGQGPGGDMGSAGPNPMDGGPGQLGGGGGGGPDGGGGGGMASRDDRMMMLQQLLGQQQQQQQQLQQQQAQGRDDPEDGTYV